MEYIYSVIPSLVAIIIAIWTKQVIPSLLIGLWVGSLLLTQSLLSSVGQTVDYIVGVLTDTGNINVLLFLYMFSGLVALIQISGGIQAFGSRMKKYITSSKRMFMVLWGLLPITFIDCGFRVVATGAIVKSLSQKYNVSKERLAYMLNNSASPVIILIPVATTFVGYVLGVVGKGMQASGVEGSALALFIQSLPYQFFSFTAIAIAIFSIMPRFNFNVMKELINVNSTPNKLARHTEFAEEFHHHEKGESMKDQTGNAVKDSMEHNHDMDEKPILKPRLINLIVPLIVLLPLSFFLMWNSEEPSHSMLIALFITTIITTLLYRVQGIKLDKLVERFIKGGNQLIVTIAILAVAWPISDVSQDLGLGQLIETTLAGNLSPIFVPVLLFIVTSAVSYFIGSSWGSWALMMPIAFTLAVSTGSALPIALAAVLSGGTFGDVTSPVSGMTAMAAGIAEADHMKYVKAMSPYNLTAGAIAALLFLVVPFIL
ncbi:Na+/H+ antiporter NhaC family protein [Aquibacillus albus]|uniref:Na+/H+ antiporter NhaC n=1 Tax=Aquibacillus albus TaxID=1168171 RepID=A0ABS2N585_9BACI|nr:Na+/H+ antiporter NhaC family protein [Aquibacillus albus]MBM7573283.1 Na+/H+ antiporter NhaC [Aquibacillus albus]